MSYSRIIEKEGKLPTMIITGNPVVKDMNYGRTASLYNEVLLCKQRRCHFITIPQTTINHKELNDLVQTISKTIRYSIVAQEKHEDGKLHYHLCLSFKSPISVKQIHYKLLTLVGDIAGSINYQEAKDIQAVIKYIRKENNFIESGEAPKHANTKSNMKDLLNEDLSYIYTSELETGEALETIKNKQPAFYTQYQDKIRNVLEQRIERPKWDYVTYTTENTVLKPYQQQVWDIISERPKPRQIIWVYGKPNSGKSFLYNYINENYAYGLYSAGQSASLDNVIFGYNEEGVIAWDIPKAFDFNQLGDALASTIEKFSDFGQVLTSKKYSGKKVRVLGHTLVFSNHKPLDQLSHRDIVLINTADRYEKVITKEINGKQIYQINDNENTWYFYSKQDLEDYLDKNDT